METRLLFIDTETTGLTHADRVITLGMVLLDLEKHLAGAGGITTRHLVFNPGRPSNPFAAAVHGFDDWDLKFQPEFCDHAADLLPEFRQCERIFAHNAAFDERFVRAEFRQAGVDFPEKRFECTLRAYKARHARAGGLDRVLEHMGHAARGKRHGALEDAWFCMLVHLWLEGISPPETPRGLSLPPENWRRPESRPIRGAKPVRYG